MSTQPQPGSRKIVHYALKADGALLSIGGIFLLLKDKFMEFELLGATGDMILGGGLLMTGIASHIIADKFFQYRQEEL